jgi:thiamine kinase-like enzyme
MTDGAVSAQVLEAVLGGVLGRRVEIASARLLRGGVGARSVHVVADFGDCVVRLPRADVGDTLALDDEAALLNRLASRGLAPAALGFDAAAGVLVTEFIAAAKPLGRDAFRERAELERLAAMLRELHAVPVTLRPFEPLRYAASYINRARGRAEFDSADRSLARELVELATAYAQRFVETVPCHNDLIASNVLDCGRLLLVDFEYAVSGAPVVDLASIIVMNDLDDVRGELVEAYYGRGRAPFGAVEFATVIRMMRLMSYFWALASFPEPLDRLGEAAFLDRARLLDEPR